MPERNLMKYILTALLFGIFVKSSFSQKYTARDSVEIYTLLEQAEKEDLAGKLEEAAVFAKKALILSQHKSMLRGEGFAWLKQADIQLKKDGAAELETFYQKAISIGKKINDPFLTGLAYFQKCQQASQEGNYPVAEKNATEALNYFIKAGDNFYVGYAYNELGFISEKLGKYEEAVSYNLKAIPLFEKAGSIKEASNTLGNLAVIYYKLGRKEDALKMFKQSATGREKIQDVKGLAATYGNIVTVYMPLNSDSVRKYLDLQLYHAEKSGAVLNKAQAYENFMLVNNKEKKYAEALEYEKKAIDIYEEIGNKLKLGHRYISGASLLNKLNDSIGAEQYFEKAKAIAEDLNNKPLLQSFYQELSSFYKERKNYELSLLNTTRYYLYRDSIINEKTQINITELQAKYDAEKKDNEISRLRTEEKINQLQVERQAAIIKGNLLEADKREKEILLLNQQQQIKDENLKIKEDELLRLSLMAKNIEQENLLKKQESEKQKLWLLILAGSFLAASVLTFVLLRQYRLKQKYKQQQKLLEVRSAISKDLHDEIGSTLTSINILSSVSQQAISQDPAQAKEMLKQITQQSKAIQQNMSDIVWSIRPENENIENLEIRMREYAAQTLEPLNISTQIHFNKNLSEASLPQNYRKDVLLIFKEAITNIVKHSNATEVKIDFSKSTENIQLIIKDNGSWKQAENQTTSGTGTKSMEQRAQNNGGYLSIDKAASKITVTIPVP